MKYNIEKKDLVNMYMKYYTKISIFYLIVITFIFIVVTRNYLSNNFTTLLIFYLILIFMLGIIFFIFNIIFTNILANKNKHNYGDLTVDINKEYLIINKTNFDLNKIKKLKINKKQINFYYNKHYYLLFKNYFEDKNDFQKLLKQLSK